MIPMMLWRVLAIAVFALPAAAQPGPSSADLTAEMAASIADAVRSDTAVRLSFPKEDAGLQAEVSRLLSTRGVRVVESGDATLVRATCGSTLVERVCAAQVVRRDGVGPLIVATRPLGRRDAASRDPVVAIELQPIYTQRDAMLDVAAVGGGQLLVLTPETVALVAGVGGPDVTGRTVASQPIRTGRVWPRDVRGMLRVTGATFVAFLPGVTCRGTTTPFALTCADEPEAWPIGLDNSGVAASRNTFATPEGLTFYEAAVLDGGRSLVVNEQGVLTWLDARRRAVARGEATDHVTAVSDPCGGDALYLVTAVRATESNAEALRVARATASQLVPLASTVALPGVLTSLWGVPGARAATAIVLDSTAGRYEAFRISLSCAR